MTLLHSQPWWCRILFPVETRSVLGPSLRQIRCFQDASGLFQPPSIMEAPRGNNLLMGRERKRGLVSEDGALSRNRWSSGPFLNKVVKNQPVRKRTPPDKNPPQRSFNFLSIRKSGEIKTLKLTEQTEKLSFYFLLSFKIQFDCKHFF